MQIPIKERNRPIDQRFNRAPAGWSLTEPLGKWAWEKPPKHTSPGEAVDSIIEKIEGSEQVYEQFAKLMFAGISIEEIIDTVAIGGFMQGEFSPDVAEIIKAPLALYFLGMAAENNIPVKIFNSSDGQPLENRGMSDVDLDEIMQENNPSLYEFMANQADQMPDEEPMQGGFLAVATISEEEEE
tara:strand:+ start:591 stop:1142 length:552 start_codon:yes stop_codon:yes gene_type:complete